MLVSMSSLVVSHPFRKISLKRTAAAWRMEASEDCATSSSNCKAWPFCDRALSSSASAAIEERSK